MTQQVDFLIVGGGIVAAATALELQTRHPQSNILMLEKEQKVASHQSSHNSGVVHAGVYYTPGSLKARFCKEGVQATRDFCAEHGVAYNQTGKLIVATSEEEMERMRALGERARTNGVEIEDVDQAGLREAAPNISGLGALFSPKTAITDYGRIAEVMTELFVSRGGQLQLGTQVLSGEETATCVKVKTSTGDIEAGHVVTCAGLHADRIIRAFGQEPGFKIIPFRGVFFKLINQPEDLVKHLIYPVPDPSRPFLGVHLTLKVNGSFTVGPNAVLAFKREGYDNLTAFSAKDMADTLTHGGFWKMMAANASSAVYELSSTLSKRVYLERVRQYCPRVQLGDLAPYPAGIRAQAIANNGTIVDDFLFVESDRCLHVGSAPSPAATSSIPIASSIADRIN